MVLAAPVRFVPFAPGAGAYRALARLLTAVWPEQPASPAWLERADAARDPARPFWREVAAAADGSGEWLGVAEVGPGRWAESTRRLELQVHVLPDRRRRGIGSALHDRAVAWLAGRATSLAAETREDRADAVRFLARRGFAPAGRNQISELDLASFRPERFAAAVRRVTAAGVELRDLADGRGDDDPLMASLHALQREVQADAPGEAERAFPGFAEWRRSYRDNPDLLPEAHVVAVDRDDLVGMTQLWASQATDAILYTGFTGVRRSHRRRGIATALKVRSLGWARCLRTADGRSPIVRTGNEESNPMLAVNLALGFRVRPASLLFVRQVPPADAGPLAGPRD